MVKKLLLCTIVLTLLIAIPVLADMLIFTGKVILRGTVHVGATGSTAPVVEVLTDAATVTWTCSGVDLLTLATLSQSSQIANPSDTCADGQIIRLRIKSSTSRALTWGSIFRGSTDASLPPATGGTTKTDYFSFIYNAADSKLDFTAEVKGF